MATRRKTSPRMTVETRLIADLVLDPVNARLHGPRNLDAIRASLRRFGQRKPLVIDKTNVVVAGNGTLEVMRDEGWEECVVTVFPGTAAEARAFAITDNRTAELAHWDGHVLTATLRDLDPDLLDATGYLPDDLADLVERFGKAPDLDDLARTHGAPNTALLWPTLRVQAPQEVLDSYEALTASLGGEPHELLEQVIAWAERGKRSRSSQ